MKMSTAAVIHAWATSMWIGEIGTPPVARPQQRRPQPKYNTTREQQRRLRQQERRNARTNG